MDPSIGLGELMAANWLDLYLVVVVVVFIDLKRRRVSKRMRLQLWPPECRLSFWLVRVPFEPQATGASQRRQTSDNN